MLIARQKRRKKVLHARRRLKVESLETRALLTTFFVDGDLGGPGADGTAESPFATIQQGVQAAITNPGDDEVIVAPRSNGGMYQGTIQIAGGDADAGNLVLRGATGQAADVVLTTNDGEAIYIGAAFEVTIQDVKIDSPAFHGILSRSTSLVTVDNVEVVGAGFPNGPFFTGIVHQDGDLIVRNSRLQDNWQGLWSAEWRDPNDEEVFLSRPNNLTIENTLSTENRAHGFYARNATGDVALIDVTSSGNNISGLRAYRLGSLSVAGSVFSDNNQDGTSMEEVEAPTITGSSFLDNRLSGAYFLRSPNLTVSNSDAVGNGLHGVKINAADGVTIDGVVADNNGSITSNFNLGGGGIGIVPGTAAPIVISNSTVTNNETRGNGGGIEVWAWNRAFNANVTVSATEVRDNTIAPDLVRNGGGIGVFGYSNLTLVDSTVDGNAARGTGGVHFHSNGTANDGEFATLSISNSTISDNVFVPEGPGTGFGSAGVRQAGGWLEITGSTIAGNQGGTAGGAYLSSLGGQISNSTISGNQGATAGGIYAHVGRSELAIRYATITDNHGGMVGGLYSEWPEVTVGNSVIAGNSVPSGSASPETQSPKDLGGQLTSVGGNFFGESETVVIAGDSQATASDFTGTVAEPLDPELGPLQDNGGPTLTHAPLPGSPLIDSGIDTIAGLPTVDQRGVSRPQGLAVDIGAVEDVVYAPEVMATSAVLNLNSADKGNKTVTIVLHSSAELDASLVDLQSLVWAGTTVDSSSLKDVDGDGDADLVLKFKLRESDLVERYREALIDDDSTNQHHVDVPLSGTTTDGTRILGSASVDLVMTGKSLREILATV